MSGASYIPKFQIDGTERIQLFSPVVPKKKGTVCKSMRERRKLPLILQHEHSEITQCIVIPDGPLSLLYTTDKAVQA